MEREPQSVDPFLAGVRRRNRRILVATILVFVLPLGYVARSFALNTSRGYSNFENRFFDRASYEHDLTAEQRDAIEKAVAESRARVAERKKAWRAAIDAAIAGGLTGRPDLGRCATTVSPPSHTEQAYLAWPSWLTIAKSPEAAAAAEPALYRSQASDIDEVERRAQQPHTDRDAARLVSEAQQLVKRDERWDCDVLLIVDKRVAPVAISKEAGFASGEVDGRAFLYDYRRNAVTCAGHVHAENSDDVHFKYTRQLGSLDLSAGSVERDRALADDLDIETYRAAAQAVRFRAGPPLPAGEDPAP